ncbi:ureidoglycolate lyase [Pseudanabaena sp. ABRG5-3]|uniref:ureidoglycolate lyase n=1 Tax=Pseudanabaena sp. ABRG5-3 TaxID=685565 RepID=UPI000DC6DAEE|nr:ureidoglycolate lyase [Pseudanabaena sp. ABRG5-3]BBC22267.1 ureidoglycolate hydrolase [Pseudanabaena sp. ABRG5-3]
MAIANSPTQLTPQLITPENFQPYGQVIFPTDDGKQFDENDAQLSLAAGIPRFYIMHLRKVGLKFHSLARHQQCTQCLGSLGSKEWFMAVAPASSALEQINLEQIAAFRITGNCFIKLNAGTWHAGPLFAEEFIDFYNLELHDTNINDYEVCNLRKLYNLSFDLHV